MQTAWPDTPWSLIRRARASEDPAQQRAAVDRLLQLYYRPVHGFFARVLALEAGDAEDVTQGLFARLLERDFVDRLRHERSFRGFMKLACRRHLSNWRASEAASRRALLRAAGGVPEPDAATLETEIDAEHRRHYIGEAVRRTTEELKRSGKAEAVAIFEARTRFDGSRPEDYAALASRFGIQIYDIQNRLALARKIFRRELLRLAAERADEAREELRELGLLRYLEEQ